MLKRTLPIGILAVLALTVMGFGPVDAPSAVPAEGELEVELDEWIVVFMWGTTGTPARKCGACHAPDRHSTR